MAKKEKYPFTDKLKLQCHQLKIHEWYSTWVPGKSGTGNDNEICDGSLKIPDKWELTQGIDLYGWQKDCVNSWFANDYKGTVKVVTGAGKTLLALAIMEKVQNECCPDLTVVIVVPTIVLMNQWRDELLKKGNLPESTIGRLGGGYSDTLTRGKRILIAVGASARRMLPRQAKKAEISKQIMLVVDECHKSGSQENMKIFDMPRKYNLGLSATPEREDSDQDGNQKYDQSDVGLALGKIIFELNYAQALELSVIPPFTINHYGLPLLPDEKNEYEQLSREISDLRTELKYYAPPRIKTEGDFWKWLRGPAQSSDISGQAMKLTGSTARRKDLLYRSGNRINAVKELLKREYERNKETRVILFNESIKNVMELFFELKKAGFPVIVEHSELPNSVREDGLNLFREGKAKVLLSVKSLIEGFNVPEVDVGIVVASTSSVRQRIQSMGRVMRKHRGADGEENTSCIHILYMRETVDDLIYGKLDWEKVLGADSNNYFHWQPGEEPSPQDGPPRSPLPSEMEVDPAKLNGGDIYPGRYEGDEFSCDSSFNVKNAEGVFVADSSQLAKQVAEMKGPGRFKVTPNKSMVLIRVPNGDDWETLFVCKLPAPLRTLSEQPLKPADKSFDLFEWAKSAKPGDKLPSSNVVIEDNFKFTQKRGGKIAKRIPGGEAYARNIERAEDKDKGKDCEELVACIRDLMYSGIKVTKIEMTPENVALYMQEGECFFIKQLAKGLEFSE